MIKVRFMIGRDEFKDYYVKTNDYTVAHDVAERVFNDSMDSNGGYHEVLMADVLVLYPGTMTN